MDKKAILKYSNHLKALGIGPEGHLIKLERVADVLRYLRVVLDPEDSKSHTAIGVVENSINSWKCSDKKKLVSRHLEELSDSSLSFQSVQAVVEKMCNCEDWGGG